MPVQKQGQEFVHISDVDKERISEEKKAGFSFQKIGPRLNQPHTTMIKI